MGLSKLRNGNVSTLSLNHGFAEKEYFWACDLSSENKSYKWKVGEEDLEEEEEDEDYIEHSLIIRSVCLGPGAVENEENIVVMESIGEDGKVVQGTIANLTKGVCAMMCDLSLTVSGKHGATFTLVNGNGPISICGSHLLDFPQDEDLDGSQTDDSRLHDMMGTDEEGEGGPSDEKDEEDEEEEEDSMKAEEEEEAKLKSKGTAMKRKAPASKPTKQQKQKAKMSIDEDEEEDEEDDDDLEEEDEESESEEEEVKAKKNKKVQQNGKAGKETGKAKPKVTPVSAKTDKKGSAKKGKK